MATQLPLGSIAGDDTVFRLFTSWTVSSRALAGAANTSDAAVAASNRDTDFTGCPSPWKGARWNIQRRLGKPAGKDLFEVARILDRVAADVVVEIGPGRAGGRAMTAQRVQPVV